MQKTAIAMMLAAVCGVLTACNPTGDESGDDPNDKSDNPVLDCENSGGTYECEEKSAGGQECTCSGGQE